MPYRLSPLAERDLDEIWSYVAEDPTPTTADRLVDDIIRRFDLLAEQPGMGRARPEFGIGVRSFAVENDVIYWPSRRERRSDRPRSSCTPRSDRGLVGVKLRFQASPNRRRKSARSGWNADDVRSAAREKSLRSASNRSRPFTVLAA